MYVPLLKKVVYLGTSLVLDKGKYVTDEYLNAIVNNGFTYDQTAVPEQVLRAYCKTKLGGKLYG